MVHNIIKQTLHTPMEPGQTMSRVTLFRDDLTFTYDLIIQDAEQQHLLLQTTPDGWSLPSIQPTEHHFGVVGHINRLVQAQWGLSVATLRCVNDCPDCDDDPAHLRRTYLLECLTNRDLDVPQGYIWVPHGTAQAALPEVVGQALHWQQTDAASRVPWMRPGWFAQAAAWVEDVADRMDMVATGPVQQRRVWWRSATLYLPTNQGRLYLKAVPSLFSYEPILTRVLSLRYPGHAPDVRAIHQDYGWMLTRDFGQTLLTDRPDVALWTEALQRFADMQVDLTRMSQALVALGVPDRNVDQLAAQAERLMQDLPDALSQQEQTQLRRALPTLRTLCFELTDHNIPLSLGHGDLWPSNIAVNPQGQTLIFDWSDSTVTHPFFDLAFFLQHIEQDLPDVPDARQRLRDAYLDCWTRYEPLANLRRAYALASVLGPLHQAITYQRYILPAMEQAVRWEMANMLPFLLRQVLTALARFEHE